MHAVRTNPLVPTSGGLPALVAHHVGRPHLVERLQISRGRQVAVLSAPAGYGKTSLAIEFLRQSELPVVWLTIDGPVDSPATWWRQLVGALRDTMPSFPDPAEALLTDAEKGAADPIVGWLTYELSDCTSMVLGIDNLHNLDSSIVRTQLGPLVERLPTGVRLVVTSRQVPELPLRRLRLQGRLTELSTADLAFSLPEAGALLTEQMGLRLDALAVRGLWNQSEGWPAGVFLNGLEVEAHHDHTLVASLLDRESLMTSDYLLNEVFDRVQQDDLAALRVLAILGECDVPSFRAVAGSGAKATLERLCAANVFVESVDSTSFRFRLHGSAANVLRREFGLRHPEEAAAVRLRAVGACFEAGWPTQALRHATELGRSDLIIGILSAAWIDIVCGPNPALVVDALCMIDPAVLDDHDFLRFVSQACQAIDGDASRAMGGFREMDLEASSEDESNVIAVLHAAAALRTGDSATAAELLAQASPSPPAAARTLAVETSGWSAFWLGDMAEAEGRFRLLSTRLNDRDARRRVSAAGALAVTLVERKRYEEASSVAEAALVDARRQRLDFDASAALLYLAIGDNARQRGDMTASIASCERGVELAAGAGPLMQAYSLLSLIQSVSAGEEDAERTRDLVSTTRSILDECASPGVTLCSAWHRSTRSFRRRAYGADGLVESLTEREMTQLQLLPSDLTQRELAARLGISLNTVKTHNRSIYRKLMVSDRSSAIHAAREHGLLDSGGEPSAF